MCSMNLSDELRNQVKGSMGLADQLRSANSTQPIAKPIQTQAIPAFKSLPEASITAKSQQLPQEGDSFISKLRTSAEQAMGLSDKLRVQKQEIPQTGGKFDNIFSTPTPQPTPIPVAPVPTAVQNFPGTIKTLSELQNDPLTLKANPSNWLSDVTNAIGSAISRSVKSLANTFPAIGITGITPTAPKTPTDALTQGLESINSTAGLAFSPISALFSVAKDTPVLGSVAKLIELPFSAIGEGGSYIGGQIVDQLPISQQAKDQIKPGIQEIFALAGQLALGKIVEIAPEVKDSLIKRFGEKDANTIIEKAKTLAVEKQNAPTQPIQPAEPTTPQTPVGKFDNIFTQPEVKPVSPLAQEAQKYKSAEEFVKAQGTSLYSGSKAKFEQFDFNKADKGGLYGNSAYMTPDAKRASSYGDNVTEYVVPKNAKLLKESEFESRVRSITPSVPYGDITIARAKAVEQFIKEGYDGVKAKDTTAIFNPKALQTKSQLTDIWKQANPENGLLQEAKKYKSAEEFVKKNNPVDAVVFRAERNYEEYGPKMVSLNIAANDLVKGKGITKEYTLNALKEAFNDGATRIQPSLGGYTKEGKGFMDTLVRDGWVTKTPNGTYFTTEKIKTWETKSQLTDIWNQANKK